MIKELKALGDQLFNNRQGIMNFWQHSADNFYPERADFTRTKAQGEDFAADMVTSYPMRARRDLGNLFSVMLKKDKFKMRTNRKDREDTQSRQWLESATKTQINAMSDPAANLSKATKEGDHDIAAFGQCAFSTNINPKTNTLIYQAWHLRDVAWMENEVGLITTVFRKWKPTATSLVKLFPNTVSSKVKEKLALTPYAEINVMHCIMPAEDYANIPGCKHGRHPYVSIWIDCDNDIDLECVGSIIQNYTIPRWVTIQGSQYATSPAVTASISDARTMQIMMETILEAGEKSVNPPMIGYPQALRSDLQVFAGGFTAIDREYDERTGPPIRPLEQGKYGIPIGLELLDRTQKEISEAWFLNKLNLPPQDAAMTAYEVAERVKEFVRSALPLIQPLEAEWPAAICQNTFTLMMANGAFGSVAEIPQMIQGADVEFVFESPLVEAEDQLKAQKLLNYIDVIRSAAELDPEAVAVLNTKKAVREVGLGSVEAGWLRTEDEVEQIAAANQQRQMDQEKLDQAQQLVDTVKTGREAEVMK